MTRQWKEFIQISTNPLQDFLQKHQLERNRRPYVSISLNSEAFGTKYLKMYATIKQRLELDDETLDQIHVFYVTIIQNMYVIPKRFMAACNEWKMSFRLLYMNTRNILNPM